MIAQANDFTSEDIKSIRANNMAITPAIQNRIDTLAVPCIEDLAKDMMKLK